MKLTALLSQYRVQYHDGSGHHHARSGWVQTDCPFCGPRSNNFHLGYNTAGRYFNCYKCGSHRTTDVLAALLGVDRGTAFKLGGGLDFSKLAEFKPRGVLKIPPGVGPMLRAHRQYLRGRHFDPTEIERLWHVQGIGKGPHLAWRLFIPIYFRGEVVSWTTRTIGERGLRYRAADLTDERIPRTDLLYGMDACRDTIIVVEGPTDVWRIGPGAAATLGTGYSRRQVELISRFPRRVICFDPEPEAQRRAKKLLREVESFPGDSHNAVLERAEDPGSVEAVEEVTELRRRFLSW